MQELLNINQIGLIILLSAATYLVSKQFKVNQMPIFVLVGLGLSLILPVQDPSYHQGLVQLLMLFVGIVLFKFGTEINLSEKLAWHVGAIGTVVLGLLLLALSYVLLPIVGFTDFPILFVAIIATLASYSISNEILSRHAGEDKDLKELSTIWMVGSHLIIIPVFAVIAELGAADSDGVDLLGPTVAGLIFTVVVVALNKAKLASKVKSVESKFIYAILISGFLVVLSQLLSLPAVVTAFGIGVSTTGLFRNKEEHDSIGLISKIATGAALITLGALVNFTSVNIPLLLVILLVMIPLKTIIHTVVDLWFGFSLIDSLGTALSQAQVGEIGFALAAIGLFSGWFEADSVAATILASVLIGAVITPFLYVNVDWLHDKLEARLRKSAPNLHRSLYINTSRKQIVRP